MRCVCCAVLLVAGAWLGYRVLLVVVCCLQCGRMCLVAEVELHYLSHCSSNHFESLNAAAARVVVQQLWMLRPFAQSLIDTHQNPLFMDCYTPHPPPWPPNP